MCALAGLAATIITLQEVPRLAADGWLPSEPVNTPLGTARGAHPGRVTWVHDPTATKWTGSKTTYWWQEDNTDQAVVDSMMSRTIRWLAGAPTDAQAWEVLFQHFNQSNGRGNVGYQVGEKIAIKVNLNNSARSWGNAQNVSPQVIHALLWQLMNQAGVINQSDIIVTDPSRIIGQPIWDFCHANFPQVKFVDREGGDGRLKAHADTHATAAIYFGDNTVWSDGLRYPATCFTEATYVINLGLLRGHNLAGITICAKNHFGSTWVNYDTTQWHQGWTPGGPDPMNGMHGFVAANDYDFGGGNWVFVQRPQGSYSALVDLMGHKDLGGKTLLFLVDGLYGAKDQTDAVPFKWQSAPFNQHWTASLFASQDGVAIESVCLDFLRSEPGCFNVVKGTVDNHLHEAALADQPPSGTRYDPERDGTPLKSLGVHEHWNNATDKQYSRNLKTGNGIELISSPPNDLTFVKSGFTGDGFSLDFLLQSTAWISVETSSDLRAWSLVGSVASTNETTLLVDESASTKSHRFYRLRWRGYSAEQAGAQWAAQGNDHYQYQLRHVHHGTATRVLTATVTAHDGQKTISEAMLNEQPLEQPAPNDFPSIEELLVQLEQAQQVGCWRVAVIYDPIQSFPIWCVIEKDPSDVPVPSKQTDVFQISNLTLIEP